MSKPKRPWNGFARYMVYNYPTLCREEKHLHDTTITPAYGGAPGGGGRTDKTADAALRELPEAKRRQLEADCSQSRDAAHRFYMARGMSNTHYKFTMPL